MRILYGQRQKNRRLNNYHHLLTKLLKQLWDSTVFTPHGAFSSQSCQLFPHAYVPASESLSVSSHQREALNMWTKWKLWLCEIRSLNKSLEVFFLFFSGFPKPTCFPDVKSARTVRLSPRFVHPFCAKWADFLRTVSRRCVFTSCFAFWLGRAADLCAVWFWLFLLSYITKWWVSKSEPQVQSGGSAVLGVNTRLAQVATPFHLTPRCCLWQEPRLELCCWPFYYGFESNGSTMPLSWFL